MYAIMIDDGKHKDILTGSLRDRSEESLQRLVECAEWFKSENPEQNYYVVKIDLEIVS
jgi:hypothetical protein